LPTANGHNRLWDVYKQYRQELYAYALSITRNSTLAEDAVHSSFLAAVRHCEKVKNPRAYVFQILRNTALGQVKTAQKNQCSEGIVSASFLTSPRHSNPGYQCLENEAVEQVDRAMDRIPFEQKETIVLRIYAGLKFREIAKLLDEPIATVTSRYRWALEALAGQLKEYFDEKQRR
jgi:RNA polymerase sigma-70 factor, ECF subfamily